MFGKLPSKRDFVSYNMPRPFLDHWEGWLQASVASSRHQLGAKWQEIFLSVPIWRFWFGKRVYGIGVTGALMPSVDGVGRYFPLTLCACEPEGMRLLPPPSEDLEVWLDKAELFLLHLLEDNLEAELDSLLSDFPFAPAEPRVAAPAHEGPVLAWTASDGSLAAAFKTLDIMNDDEVHGGRSYWWTNGGGVHSAQLSVLNGRADSHFLVSLMTGSFG